MPFLIKIFQVLLLEGYRNVYWKNRPHIVQCNYQETQNRWTSISHTGEHSVFKLVSCTTSYFHLNPVNRHIHVMVDNAYHLYNWLTEEVNNDKWKISFTSNLPVKISPQVKEKIGANEMQIVANAKRRPNIIAKFALIDFKDNWITNQLGFADSIWNTWFLSPKYCSHRIKL